MKDQKNAKNGLKNDKRAFSATNVKKRLLILIWFIVPLIGGSFFLNSASTDFGILGAPSHISSPNADPPANCSSCHTLAITANDCDDCHNGTFAPLPNTTLDGAIKFDHHNTTDPVSWPAPQGCDDSDCHGSSSDYRHVVIQEVDMKGYCEQAGGCHTNIGKKTDPFNPDTCGKCHISQPTAKATTSRSSRATLFVTVISVLIALSTASAISFASILIIKI